MTENDEKWQEASSFIKQKMAFTGETAVILGSGLVAFTDNIKNCKSSYQTTVSQTNNKGKYNETDSYKNEKIEPDSNMSSH